MKVIVLGVTALWVPASNSCFRSLLSTFEIIASCTQYKFMLLLYEDTFLCFWFCPFSHSIPLSWLSPLLYCQALPLNLKTFILNKNLSWLCLYLFLSPLPSFLGAFTQYSLISPVPHCFQGTPNAVNTFQSLFCCLHLLTSLKLFLWLPWHHLYSVLLPDSSAFSLWIFPHLPRTLVFVKLVLGYFMIALHSP